MANGTEPAGQRRRDREPEREERKDEEKLKTSQVRERAGECGLTGTGCGRVGICGRAQSSLQALGGKRRWGSTAEAGAERKPSHDGGYLVLLPLSDLVHYWPRFPFLHSRCFGQFQLAPRRIISCCGSGLGAGSSPRCLKISQVLSEGEQVATENKIALRAIRTVPGTHLHPSSPCLWWPFSLGY